MSAQPTSYMLRVDDRAEPAATPHLQVLKGATDQTSPARVAAQPPTTASPAVRPGFAGQVWLGAGDLLLPIQVNLSWSDSHHVIAEDPRSGIFGSGVGLGAALEDFRLALTEHRAFLEASSPLSPQLEETLEYLRRHLKAE